MARRYHPLVLHALCFAVAASFAGPAWAADIRKVGITVGSLGNPYYAVTDKGIADQARLLTPGAQVNAVSADYDLGKQFNQIQNFVASGVNIIMLNAVDPVAIGPAIKHAQSAGVIVAGFDVAAKGADVTVMTDNVQAGVEACQYNVDHLPGAKGDVVILNGPQISAIVDRVAGCKKVFSANPGIHILSSDQDASASREGGLAKGTGLLTRYSKIDAIFAINDPTAIGMNLAAKQLHRNEFIITSVDGSPDVAGELKDGTSLIKASAAQDPYGMAAEAYRLAVDIKSGKHGSAPVILISPTLITSSNIASYVPWNTKPHPVAGAGQ